MKEKTTQLLAYLIQGQPGVSITSLMKLSYICDIVSIKKYDKQISNFEYIRYKYGPFNTSIYEHISKLLIQGVIKEEHDYTPMGQEFITYKYTDNAEMSIDKISAKEKEVINEVVDSLRGYGARALVDVSYNTKPMKKLGAKQDNEKGMNEPLDLWAR